MVFDFDKNKELKEVPHKSAFDNQVKKFKVEEYQAIRDKLNTLIDSDEIFTSSWIPGKNWEGTVFQPIYHVCGGNQKEAAGLFGLILLDVFIEREDKWGKMKASQIRGIEVNGSTYFRIDKMP